MSNPNPPASQTIVINQKSEASVLGMAGLVLSALGWLTCGLLCIPGTFICILSLIFSSSKKYALAGLIVGFPGTLFFIFVGLGMITAMLGIGASATAVAGAAAAAKQQQAQMQTQDLGGDPEPAPVEEDPDTLPEHVTDGDQGEPAPMENDPETATLEQHNAPAPPPDELPVNEPQTPEVAADGPKVRTFSDASGRFTVEAEVLGHKQGFVKLKRTDDGKEVVVKVDSLSPEDGKWLEENFPGE